MGVLGFTLKFKCLPYTHTKEDIITDGFIVKQTLLTTKYECNLYK